VVLGDGQTAIGREIVFHLIKSEFPARRNLESPEAEFSVPLCVLGQPSYPTGAADWLWLPLKSLLAINKNPAHRHFLILELNFTNPELLTYWLEVLKPETALIAGQLPVDYSQFGIKKVVKINQTHPDELLKPFMMAAEQIGRYYRLEPTDINLALSTFTLPTSKIRFFPGAGGSTIIDATHYYFPVQLSSVLELIGDDLETSNRIIFTTDKRDLAYLQKFPQWVINPKGHTPKQNEVFVLRGDKRYILAKFGHLFASKMPLI